MCEGGCCPRGRPSCPRRRGPVRDEGAEAAGHGGGEPASRPPDARGMAGRRPLPDRCARPARPASLTHSLRRVDAQPDPERLAPATVLTLRRTPHACAGRYPGSSWAPTTPLDARWRCPPLPSRQVPRDVSAGSRRPPQAMPCHRFEPARMAALLWHPQHPWEGVPPSVCALAACVYRQRANCHLCRLYKAQSYMYIRRYGVKAITKSFFCTFLQELISLCT